MYINECAGPFAFCTKANGTVAGLECIDCSEGPKKGDQCWAKKIPTSIDLISLDMYCSAMDSKMAACQTNGVFDPAAEVKWAQPFYETQIKPRLLSHQRMFIIPGTFADWNQTRSGPIEQQQAGIVRKLDAYWAWALSDPLIVGLNCWHWRTIPGLYAKSPGIIPFYYGVDHMPKVVARLTEIGSTIRNETKTKSTVHAPHPSLKSDDLDDPATVLCTTDMDCSLNGVCSTAGLCRCDQPWSGPTCGKLTFRPASFPGAAAYGFKPNVTSWGASPIQAADGTWHIFVSEIAGRGCGLTKWRSQSRVAHATAPFAMGPYKKQDVALAVEAHNPHVIKFQGAYLLFHIGSAASTHPIENCTSSTTDGESVPPSAATAAISSTALIHRSDSLNGPWVPANTTMPGPCVNPAPWVMNNGSLAVVCSGADLHNRTWHLLVSDETGLTGQWTSRPIFPGVSPPTVRPHKFWEDPVLFMDAQNHWHILSHCYVPHYDESNDYISGHLFSEDGLTWNESNVEPYRHSVIFQGGQVQNFSTLERPKLIVDASGRPTHLFNGVSSRWPCSPCGGCTSCKVAPGTDWTYTLVRETELGHLTSHEDVPTSPILMKL